MSLPTTTFPTACNMFDNLEIKWGIGWAPVNQNQPVEWRSIGETSNDVYLTSDTPKHLNRLYWTVVHIGSHYAEGETSENGVILKAWEEFSDRVVKQ